ncbi:hypothetical protein L1887_13988 [Cichorium endivia]|nr:hypothetical protein L1887_13988 [Cichorium endivia]
MASWKLKDAGIYNELATGSGEWTKRKLKKEISPQHLSVGVHDSFSSHNSKRLKHSSNPSKMLYSSIMRKRKNVFSAKKGRKNSDCSVRSSEVEENIVTKEENDVSNIREVYPDLMGISSKEEPEKIEKSRSQNVKKELIALTLPALAGQAIEPLALLMETAYIGRLGPIQLASAGVSISIFNIVSKLFNIPLLSVATSFVAEDIAKNSRENSEDVNGNADMAERRQLASVSTALLLAVGIGIFEGLALYFGSGVFLNLMGISSASSMHAPAQQFLSLRSLGAPAVVVSLALQGVFRGFKDTKTPVFCLGKFSFLLFNFESSNFFSIY